MKTVQTVGLVLIGLLCLPLVALAQAPSVEELRERALNAGIPQERLDDLGERAEMRSIGERDLAVILLPAVELAEQDLPSEMIFRKAMEGIAKGVQPTMMEQVLQQIRTGTEQARPMIEQWLDRPEVRQMAERSAERMDRDQFRNEMLRVSSRAVSGETGLDLVSEILDALSAEGVLDRASPASVLAAVNIAADIPSVGQQPGRTGEIISRAMQSGFSSGDLQRLPAAMNMAQRRSQLPAAAVMEGVANQLDRGVPAADILQNLFNGDVRGGGPPGEVPAGLENRPERGDDHPGRGGRPVLPGQGGGPGNGPGQGDGPGQGGPGQDGPGGNGPGQGVGPG